MRISLKRIFDVLICPLLSPIEEKSDVTHVGCKAWGIGHIGSSFGRAFLPLRISVSQFIPYGNFTAIP